MVSIMQNSIYLAIWVFGSILFVSLIFSMPLFSFMDKGVKLHRNMQLTGVRYILASMVVFDHMDFFLNFTINNKWWFTSSFMYYIGNLGVYFFFMITAFLFWGKIRDSERVDWISMYKGRLFRILPMAWLSSLLAIVVILYYTGLPSDFIQKYQNYLYWFDGGFTNIRPDINGMINSRYVTAGVTWTLVWEWGFYFILPLLYLFREKSLEFISAITFLSMYFVPSFFPDAKANLWAAFCFGMLVKEITLLVKITKLQSEILLVASILSIIILSPSTLSTKLIFVSAIGFFAVCSGADLFGLFRTKGFIRLGEASYSIYLLQGVIFYVAFKVMKENNLPMSGGIFYLQLTIVFIFLCVVSCLTFHFFERYFINIAANKHN